MNSVREELAQIKQICLDTKEKVSQLYVFHNTQVAPTVFKADATEKRLDGHLNKHWAAILAVPTIISVSIAAASFFLK